jgi:hypothetical protein
MHVLYVCWQAVPTRWGYNLLGPGAQEGSPTLLHIFLSFSVESLFVGLQINLFQTKPKSHCNRESVSSILRFSVKTSGWSALTRGREHFFLYRVPNPLSAAVLEKGFGRRWQDRKVFVAFLLACSKQCYQK